MPKNTKVEGESEIYRRHNGRLYLRLYSRAYQKEVWRSLGETKITKQVRRLVEQAKEEFYRNDPLRKTYRYQDIAEQCFEVSMVGNRPGTREEARRIYDKLIDSFGHLDINEVTDPLWLQQVEAWRESTGRTRFQHVRIYARQIDRYAFEKGLKSFICRYPVSDPNPKQGKVLTDAEIKRLLAAAGQLHKTKNRFMVPLFILFGRYMGMRKSEILGLEWSRIDLEARTVTLGAEHVKTGSRTGRGRKIRIAPEVYPLLASWREKNAAPFVFPGIPAAYPLQDMKTVLSAVCEKSGVSFRPHDLRHTFYTVKLLVEKKSIVEVSEYGGTAVSTLQNRYLHSKPEHTAGVVE